ncbi:MAG: methionine adenosyltransferase domain-containing protein [Roseburia sp.]|nr:methionine adenosyltransferase domain-containing protein [Roseburia sp.]
MSWLSDGKAQVSVFYNNMKLCKIIVNVVLSSQTLQDVDITQVRKDLHENIICEVLPNDMLDDAAGIYINPTGQFVNGGVKADCGLTGRKIIVDTYGGWGRYGDEAFSGKDSTKVNRSGSFMARYIAKNLITLNVCERADVQIAYVIGRREPMGHIDTFGIGKL